MLFVTSKPIFSALFAAGLFGAVAFAAPARADVITSSPSLPLLGIPYESPNGGAGCFLVGTVCVTPGVFTQTSVVSNMISGGNQQIVADAVYTGAVTGVVSGPVTLSGTVDETVLGRTSNDETGSFTTDITGLDLSGVLDLSPPANPLNGHMLSITLDGSETSAGTTAIVDMGGGTFRINSFFDVFVDLTLVGTPYSASTIPITLVAVPELSTWAMAIAGFAGIGFAARRRAVSTA
jgi:hypothetical protein